MLCYAEGRRLGVYVKIPLDAHLHLYPAVNGDLATTPERLVGRKTLTSLPHKVET